MRKHFSAQIERIATANDDVVFITGDLGYNALENLATALGDRFINAGVAEQNMIGVAAGMASRGFRVICYSIAPFTVYRCLEQIRNDVCFHDLPVFIVGNGGGYGYGIMGSSHHCLEDIACLSGLPNMRCYAPAFVEDMHACIDEMFDRKKPAYLRLGLGKNMPPQFTVTPFGTSPQPASKAGLTVIAQSPVANNLLAALSDNEHASNTDVFTINRMPLASLPQEIEESIRSSRNVLTIEEHISVGGIGSSIALQVQLAGLPTNRFRSLYAAGYPDGLYGSQAFHQKASGLDEQHIRSTINSYF